MTGLLLCLLLQGGAPTVGDTVWVSRTVKVPAGAVVRPAPWPDDVDGVVQSLGAPVTIRRGDSTEIRYALVVWSPGEHPVDIPGPAVLGPGPATDSLASVPITLYIASVLPDSVDPDSLPTQPVVGAVGATELSWGPPLQLGLLGAVLGAAVLFVGHRRRRVIVRERRDHPMAPDVLRWARAGELRVAQAAALARLRGMVARAVPAAATSLDTATFLGVLRPFRPDWPLLELEGLLTALESERFAPGDGDPDLVERADALRLTLERLG